MKTLNQEYCTLGCNAKAHTTAHFFGHNMPVCDGWAVRHAPIAPAACDFCQADAYFQKVYDQWGVAHWSEGINDAGSDHLAIWCGACGPKHRKPSYYGWS